MIAKEFQQKDLEKQQLIESYSYEMKLISSKCEGDILWLVRRELFALDAPEGM